MINTTIIKIPAYTTREFRNFGVHKANELYDYKFTIQDLALLNSGAIKLFPREMCDFIAVEPSVLQGVKYNAGEKVDVKNFDDKTLKTILKTHVLQQVFKTDFKNFDNTQLIKAAQLYDCVGETFKTVSTTLGLDFEKIKETFDLKQGANTKKVKASDVTKLQELLEV